MSVVNTVRACDDDWWPVSLTSGSRQSLGASSKIRISPRVLGLREAVRRSELGNKKNRSRVKGKAAAKNKAEAKVKRAAKKTKR